MNKLNMMTIAACAVLFALPLCAKNKRPSDFSRSEWKEAVQEDKADAALMVKDCMKLMAKVTATLKKIKTQQGIGKGMKELAEVMGCTGEDDWDEVDFAWKNVWESDTGVYEAELKKHDAKLTKLKNAMEKEICRVCALDPARGTDSEDPQFGHVLYLLDPYADENYEMNEKDVYARKPDAGIPAKVSAAKTGTPATKSARGGKSAPQQPEAEEGTEEET